MSEGDLVNPAILSAFRTRDDAWQEEWVESVSRRIHRAGRYPTPSRLQALAALSWWVQFGEAEKGAGVTCPTR